MRRETVDLTVGQTPIRLVRSTARRSTVSASWRDGRLQVSVPAGLGQAEEQQWIETMIRRAASRRPDAEDESALLCRARRLSAAHLDGRAEPARVSWSSRQRRRWGSCTPTTGHIRLSSTLSEMPDWVVDAVIVHELVHLIHADHSPAFHALAARYPRMDEAMAFLDGVTWATGRGLEAAPDGMDGDE